MFLFSLLKKTKKPNNTLPQRLFRYTRNHSENLKTKPMDLNSSPSSNPTYAISVNGTIPVSSTFAVSTTPFETPLPSNSSGDRKHIALWPGMYHSPVTTALWEARTKTFERLLDPPRDAPPQSELVTRTPSQSRTGILYNFSSDFVLREQYRDPWNDVRIGKLLEDLDALAGTISVKHCSDEDSTTRPLILVTASVDKIVLKKPITVNIDLTIVGSVIWVGHSSMEIQLEVTQSKQVHAGDDDSDSIVLTANFIFVARDSKTGKAAPVNRLSPETAREKLLFEQAEARNNLKKRKRGGDKKDLENGEEKKLKDLLAEGRIFCDMPALADRDSILLRDTSLENSLLCQPQQRNIHGRIFGGFLMNRAFELAFSTAYAFAGLVPYFLEVDHVDFLRPVDVGDFLRLKSCVLYTELHDPDQPLINVEVVAHVTRPELRSSEVSNTFHFSFTVRPEAKAMKNGFKLRNVVPATEEEARRILERIDADNLNEFFRT
ncbi:acyl-coenzyme A thioesterase 2, chloroplastic-like isoform X2 [Vicia villosa]|uniref:acyl-coenzyme A thioesterase 2, chloroplastic-like isoform X2 n=1 Tax=Vicia villosa TaxID=3911 RepID=UPI00273CE4E0|nr:acyl-coenzyme A thioesterase 2, chloroplastic-like isoform X2 [Vicia villosa]